MESPSSPEFGQNGAVLNSATMTDGLRDDYLGKVAPKPQVWPRRPSWFWWFFFLSQVVIVWRQPEIILPVPLGFYMAMGVAAAAFLLRGLWPMSRRAWNLWFAPVAIIWWSGLIYSASVLLIRAML